MIIKLKIVIIVLRKLTNMEDAALVLRGLDSQMAVNISDTTA
mgnify:CR=1 FL=1